MSKKPPVHWTDEETVKVFRNAENLDPDHPGGQPGFWTDAQKVLIPERQRTFATSSSASMLNSIYRHWRSTGEVVPYKPFMRSKIPVKLKPKPKPKLDFTHPVATNPPIPEPAIRHLVKFCPECGFDLRALNDWASEHH